MKKFLLSLLCLAGFTSLSAQTTYTATLANKTGKKFTNDVRTITFADETTLFEASWTFAGEIGGNKAEASAFNWDSSNGRGCQLGTSKNPYLSSTVTSSDFAEKTISKIVVNTSRAGKTDVNFSVTVGGIAFTNNSNEVITLTTTATDYTFEGKASGDIVLAWSQTGSVGTYLKSISVTYTDGTTTTQQVAKPVISPAGGEITADTEISITCGTDGATIYYTTNGDDPTEASTPYTGAFTLDADATVKAIGILNGYTNSSIASVTFTIPVIAEFGYVKSVTSGKKYLLVADDTYAATPQTNSKNYAYLAGTTVTPTDGIIEAKEALAFTINAVDGGYNIVDSYGQYIYAGSYTSVQFTTDATADILWSIEIQNDGTAKLTHISTGRYLQYSTSFSSYGMYTDSQGLMPYLYEEGAAAEEKPAEVIETANSIAEFYEITNQVSGAKATIGFDLTVIAVAGKNVYVYDGTDFSCVYGTNTLASTDVIAKGWVATYGEYNGLYEICPVDELTTTGTAGTLPEPMEISGEEIASDLQCAYVKIANVNVEPAESGKSFTGTDENETEISFYNKFGVAVPEQGKAQYDVVGIVSIFGTTLQIYPLEYIYKGEFSAIEDVEVESAEAVEYYNLQGVKVANPEKGLYIMKQGNKATKVLVK